MPVPENADVQINLVGRLYGQVTVTTFFYRFTTSAPLPDGADPVALAGAFEASLGSAFIDAVTSDWTGEVIEVRDPRANPVWAGDLTEVTLTGVLAAPACPPSVAAVITRKTALAGRRNRGRIFVPAVPQDWHQDGEISDAGMLILQGLADDVATALDVPGLGVVATLSPRVWSRTNQTSQAVTSCTAKRVLRSQRRREIGVGQ